MKNELDHVMRIEQLPLNGFSRTFLGGLGILSGDPAKPSYNLDPRFALFADVIARFPCVALVGNLALLKQYSVGELFSSNMSAGWLPAAKQSNLDTYMCEPSLLALEWHQGGRLYYEPERLLKATICGDSVLRYLMSYDAVALYSGCKCSRIEAARTLVNSTFTDGDEDEWCRKGLEVCDCLMVTSYDNSFFKINHNGVDIDNVLGPSIDLALRRVTENSWYQNNRERLVWNPDEFCLELPKS